MPLVNVENYISEARTLLQDTNTPNRYSDGDLKTALGLGLYEMRRVRPDLFPAGVPQDIDSATAGSTAVVIDPQYRFALVCYIVGHAYMRDEEEGHQQMAAAYKARFGSQLVTIAV